MCKSIKVAMLVLTVTVALVPALALTSAAAFLAVVLVSAGLLAVFAAVVSALGSSTVVVSDLSLPAMLFTGLFLVFVALFVGTALYILCPKGVRRLRNITDKIYEIV